jgi:hypothetical protein
VADHPRSIEGEFSLQLRETQLERWMGLFQGGELRRKRIEPVPEWGRGARPGKKPKLRLSNAMDVRHFLAQLGREKRTRGGELRALHQAASQPSRLGVAP